MFKAVRLARARQRDHDRRESLKGTPTIGPGYLMRCPLCRNVSTLEYLDDQGHCTRCAKETRGISQQG